MRSKLTFLLVLPLLAASAGIPLSSTGNGRVSDPRKDFRYCQGNSYCDDDKACIELKCQDPCTGICLRNATCTTVDHNPICTCKPDYYGNPYVKCYQEPQTDHAQPCTHDSACADNETCLRNRCLDPCAGVCGYQANCTAIRHLPICTCPTGTVGDPFQGCYRNPEPIRPPMSVELPWLGSEESACSPSPCGQNGQCKLVSGFVHCYCQPGYIGSPPKCKLEVREGSEGTTNMATPCLMSSECDTAKACLQSKCQDPCPGLCGYNASCTVANHTPTCICNPGYEGNPFVKCDQPTQIQPAQSCAVNHTCPENLACIQNLCLDPCPERCGSENNCTVLEHTAYCGCPIGTTINTTKSCYQDPEIPTPHFIQETSCFPSPCGPNSQCELVNDTVTCSCVSGHIGSPPECRLDTAPIPTKMPTTCLEASGCAPKDGTALEDCLIEFGCIRRVP